MVDPSCSDRGRHGVRRSSITSAPLPPCGTAPHPPPHGLRRPHGKGVPSCQPARQTRSLPRSGPGPHPLRTPSRSPAGAYETPLPTSVPLEGWRPARLPDSSWGSLDAGPNSQALPLELVGLAITVRARNGKSWDTTITAVVEQSPDRLLVRTRRLDQ